eukprot:Opistho-1_new@10188
MVRGTRNGASVSIMMRSRGIFLTMPCSSRPRRSSHTQPVMPMYMPMARYLSSSCSVPVKQWTTHGGRAPCGKRERTSQNLLWALRSCRNTGFLTRLAIRSCSSNTRSCTSRGLKSLSKSRPHSPTATTSGDCATRSNSDNSAALRDFASCGCTPQVAKTVPGNRRARAITALLFGSDVPVATMRRTPTARADASSASRLCEKVRWARLAPISMRSIFECLVGTPCRCAEKEFAEIQRASSLRVLTSPVKVVETRVDFAYVHVAQWRNAVGVRSGMHRVRVHITKCVDGVKWGRPQHGHCREHAEYRHPQHAEIRRNGDRPVPLRVVRDADGMQPLVWNKRPHEIDT